MHCVVRDTGVVQFFLNPYMKYKSFIAHRTQRVLVIIGLPSGIGADEITEQDKEAALAESVDESEWDTIATELGELKVIPADEATEFRTYTLRPHRSMDGRAREIGVTRQTLAAWKREGVDVWSDDAVRRRIGRSRKFLPQVTERFKARLSDELLRKP